MTPKTDIEHAEAIKAARENLIIVIKEALFAGLSVERDTKGEVYEPDALMHLPVFRIKREY